MIKNHAFDKVFTEIINSLNHGLMKHDENGRLFEIALEKLNESDL